MAQEGRIDPAAKIRDKEQKEKTLDDLKKLDVHKLNITDFQVVPKKQARIVHPFEGYPLQPKVDLGDGLEVSATYIVALNPTAEPPQDPSGRGITIMDAKTKTAKVVTIATSHSRMLPAGPSANVEIVFDRVLDLDGAKLHYAVVPAHEHRAQLVFFWNSKQEKIEADQRYLLLDLGQAGRLRQLFLMLINPKLKAERAAAEVAGEVEATEASLNALPTEV